MSDRVCRVHVPGDCAGNCAHRNDYLPAAVRSLPLLEQAILTANALRNMADANFPDGSRQVMRDHADDLMRAALLEPALPAAAGSHQPCGCKIVGPEALTELAVKYLGGSRNTLTSDEKEILLSALYCESEASGGLITKGLAVMEKRLREQGARLRDAAGRV